MTPMKNEPPRSSTDKTLFTSNYDRIKLTERLKSTECIENNFLLFYIISEIHIMLIKMLIFF